MQFTICTRKLRPIHLPSWIRGWRRSPPAGGEGGQATVELALALPVVFSLIVGVLELGVGFNAYVTLVSAAREGVRAGAIYLYNSSLPLSPADLKAFNDRSRETAVRDGVASSMGVLQNTPPSFDRNSDVAISYVHDPSLPLLDSRRGDLIVVVVTYRHELLSKLLSENPVLTMTARAQARIE